MTDKKPWFCLECRVQMDFDSEFNFHRCPQCKIEVWIPEEVDEVAAVAEEEAGKNDDVFFRPKRSGGTRSKASQSKKQQLKKKTTKKLYDELCN